MDRLPPQNLEAEKSVLGALVVDASVTDQIIDILSPEDFYNNSNSIIYSAICQLYKKNIPIDILSVVETIISKELLEEAGGRTYIMSLANEVSTSSSIKNHAKIIADKSSLRKLLKASREILEMSYDGDIEVEEVLESAERKIFDISINAKGSDFSEVKSLLNDAYKRMGELADNKGMINGISTGLSSLDKTLGGLQKTDLVVLAARPSVGKTTLALDIIRETAIKQGNSVAMFSLEMGKEQLIDRMICAQANTSLFDMRRGEINGEDHKKICDAMAELDRARIFIDDNADCTIANIRTKVRKLASSRGLDLLVVDYLQLMTGSGKKSMNRNLEIAEISRGLKQIAKELNIPVIALSQLSRLVEMDKPAIPKLSHLRDSGAIEQDADIVMFLYRKAADRNYERNSLMSQELNSAMCYIAKHRNGPTEEIPLYFDDISVSYKELKWN